MSGPRGSDFFVLLLRRCGCRLFSLLPVRTWRKGADGNVARRGTRENGTRMGGGAKERGRRKKGGMNERRSGEECCMAGNAGERSPEWAEERKKRGRRKSGGKWGSEEVKERRHLFRRKRATDLAEAEESRGRGRGRGAGGTLRFAVSGAGRPFAGGDERTSPAESFGRARLCCGGCRGQSPSFLRISFGRACLLTMMEVVL